MVSKGGSGDGVSVIVTALAGSAVIGVGATGAMLEGMAQSNRVAIGEFGDDLVGGDRQPFEISLEYSSAVAQRMQPRQKEGEWGGGA